MAYLLDNLDSIEGIFKGSPFGLITDIDGTISQTAPTPGQARVSPLCRRYLSILCDKLVLVAAISGRPAAKARDMVKVDAMVYIGNHGLERWVRGHLKVADEVKPYGGVIKAVIKDLSPLLSIEGISIEDKGLTASVHYRLSPDPRSAKEAILAAIEVIPRAKDLRIRPERMSVGLIPPLEENKGTATLNLIREYGLQSAIYLGDDLTDIDAFNAIHTAGRSSDFRGFAIGIIGQEMPDKLVEEADFTLNGVKDVERFLEWLSSAVPESG